MKSFILTTGKIVKAQSRLDALKSQDLFIYWKGNKPYGLEYYGAKNEIYAKLVK
jgi:hypothetical protein